MNELGKRTKDDILENRAFMVYQGACAPVEYGADRYSEGIRRLCAASDEFAALTSELARRFYAGDYGTSYARGERPREGRECGRYETEWGPIEIKRDLYYTTIYCDYER